MKKRFVVCSFFNFKPARRGAMILSVARIASIVGSSKLFLALLFLSMSLLIGPSLSHAVTCSNAAIAAGANHTVALKADGTVVAVGANSSGQLNVSSWTNIKAVAAGQDNTIGLKEDGTVVAVGYNNYGQSNVSSWTNIKAIAPGVGSFTVGLKEDGTVVAVGDNYFGQLDVSSWTNIKAIAAGGDHTVGLKEDGTVVAVGNNYSGPLNVSSWTNIKAIAAGQYHTVGLNEDGTVVAVGDNSYGQLDVSSWTNIKAIAAGANHTIGIKEDGTVVAVGHNMYGQSNVSSWTNIKAVSASRYHTVGLKEDGTIVGVGLNNYGQVNFPSWTPNIKAVAAGGGYTVGLRENGTLVAAGDNSTGQLNVSSWSSITAIAAGCNAFGCRTLGVKDDGTVVAAGSNSSGDSNVSSWTNIKAVAAGYFHTVGLKQDGTVVAVGSNSNGQLNVSSWTNIKAVAAGFTYTVGLKGDGTVVAVGDNLYGQSNVSSWTNIKAIAAGYGFTIGLKEDGTVVAVGDNYYGQLNVSSWTNIKAIAAGQYHTVGVKEDGTVVAVGAPFVDLNFSSWTGIKAVAANYSHTVGLKEDGTVVAVGGNGCDVSSSWTNIMPVCSCVLAADAGPDQTIEQTSPDGAYATLDGSGSQQGDCTQEVIYSWEWPGGSATGISPGILLSAGTTRVKLTVSCIYSSTSPTNEVAITVQDTIPPVTTIYSIAGIPGDNGWYTDNVTVTLNATDSGSGVKEIHYSINQGPEIIVPGNTATINLTSEGEATIYFNAIDNADNPELQKYLPVKIDKTNPSISGAATTLPNAHGWYKHDVTIHFTVSDIISGIAWATPDTTLTGERVQSVTGTARDNAGLASNATVTVNIDKTKPSISGAATTAPNVYGWYKSDVTTHFTAADDISGIFSVTPDTTVSSEGPGQSVTGTALDKADNDASFTVEGINIDKTRPIIIGRPTTPPNANGWYKSDVTIHFTATDDISGIASVTPDTTVGSEGPEQSVTGTALDRADNDASFTVEGINIDKTLPEVSVTATPNRIRPNNQLVDVQFDGIVSDSLSGIASCTTRVTDEYGVYNMSAPCHTTVKLDAAVNKNDPDGVRTYTIEAVAIDIADNAKTAATTVIISK